ncbi:MAG: dihydroorotase [Saprospiraceae bacterium]|jgi:dihydroorotase
MRTIEIIQPDDWHLHVRDGEMMQSVIGHTASSFGRAMIMPNLNPPVTSVDQALAYRDRITAAAKQHDSGSDFKPLMSLYLTDSTALSEIQAAADQEDIVGAKLYPSGATTNSDSGVTRISGIMPVLEKMAETSLVLQIHGEVTDPHVDIFDREAVFIEQVLEPIHREIPELKIVLEHITTSHGIDFVKNASDAVAGTLTAHHLLFNRNELFKGGIRPHYYCLPVLKREEHRQALINAATSGSDSFFLGTDSAPHTQNAKEAACGCAGCYTAHAALPLYAMAFERMEALEHFEQFASLAGPKFYGLPANTGRIKLVKQDWAVPEVYLSDDQQKIIPLLAGETLDWQVVEFN